MDKELERTKRKTTLEMFKEIKDLEVADSPLMTVEDCLPFMCEKVEQALQHKSLAERCWKICKKYGIEIFSFKSYFVDMKQDYEYYKEHYKEYQNLLIECMPQAEFETLKKGLK